MAKLRLFASGLVLTVFATVFALRLPVLNGNRIVVSGSGKDEVACWNGNISCRTVDFAMKKDDLNDTRLVIRKGIYNLSTVIKKKFMQNFTMAGEPYAQIRCNASQAGFFFGFSNKITIENLTLAYCGAEFPSTNVDDRKRNSPEIWNISTALLVEETTDLSMSLANISHSQGYGAVFYDVVGNVEMSYVTFCNNTLANHAGPGFSSGGGIYIEFKPKCNKPEQKNFLNSNGSYLFYRCSFLYNTAEHVTSIPSYSNCKQFISYGRGGGISFFSRGMSGNNSLTIIESIFYKNKALFGGGVFAELDDYTGKNKILLTKSLFNENTATLAGGGLRVGINADPSYGGTLVQVSGTQFNSNHAVVGGAFSQYQIEGKYKINDRISLKNCSFFSNEADKGGAAMVVLSKLIMESCNVSYNTQNSKVGNDIGEGAFYIYSSSVSFKGQNNFEGNSLSAVLFESCYAVNEGELLFRKNVGQEGGAIAFFGDSVLRMNPYASMRFENNSASKRGGALYVELPISSEFPMNSTELRHRSCFIYFGSDDLGYLDPDKSNTSTYFLGNVAPVASGNNVYANSLAMCRADGEKPYESSALKWSVFHYVDGMYKDGRTTVVTSPLIITNISHEEWNAYPGLAFKPTVVLRDENGNSVYGNIHVTVIPEKPETVSIHGQKMFLTQNVIDSIIFKGEPAQKYSVRIETTIGRPVLKIISGLKLRNCPLGYYLEGDMCQCLAGKFNLKFGVTRCESSLDIYVLKGRWGDPLESEKKDSKNFASLICPTNYCNSSDKNNNSIDRKFEKELQCASGRDKNSPLCGDCIAGYSVVFGAEYCTTKCKDNNGIAWLLLLFVIVTVFVIIIVLLNVDTYATSLNAFLYSYQIIPLCLHGNTTIDGFMNLIIGLSTLSGSGNLETGVCLWKHMNDLEKTFLNYIIPIFMLLIAFILIRVSYRFNNECFLNRGTVFKSFVFISVIAYSDFTRITLDLLHPVKVRNTWVLYKAAKVPFFKGEHLPFAIVALFVAIFVVVLFPLLVMFSYALVRLPRFVRFIGIFDTFNEPFHPVMFCDFFSAFYFLNRLILLLIFVYVPQGALQDTIFASMCVAILLVFVYFKPYRNQGMNLYDSLLLANIAIIAIINLGLNGVYTERLLLQHVAHALAYFPLFCATVKLVIWGHTKYKQARRRREIGGPNQFDNAPYRAQEDEVFNNGDELNAQ